MKKLKLIILLMLALFLVACGGATPSPSSDTTLKPGGGTTPKPGIDEVVKDDVDKEEVKIEEDDIIVLDEGKKEAIKVLDKLPDKVKNKEVYLATTFHIGKKKTLLFSSSQNFKINYKNVVKIYGNEDKISDYNFTIDSMIHLIIDENIEHKEDIHNKGHMYFIDDNVKDFTVTVPKFNNNGDIYVIGQDGGSTLTIDGNFLAPPMNIGYDGTHKFYSNLYLGMYVRDDNSITTDKVLITGSIEDWAATNVRFVYNKNDLKNHNYPKAKADDYVIRVKGKVELNAFQMDNTQNGLSSYELKASKNGEATEWKLIKKE